MPTDYGFIVAFHCETVSRAVHEGVGNKSCNCIHAEDEDWHRPGTAPLLDLQHPIEKREKNQGKATGKQRERTRPEILVDWKPEIPYQTTRQAENSDKEHANSLGAGVLVAEQQVSGQHSH